MDKPYCIWLTEEVGGLASKKISYLLTIEPLGAGRAWSNVTIKKMCVFFRYNSLK